MHGEGECVGRREVYTSVGMMKRARRHKQRRQALQCGLLLTHPCGATLHFSAHGHQTRPAAPQRTSQNELCGGRGLHGRSGEERKWNGEGKKCAFSMLRRALILRGAYSGSRGEKYLRWNRHRQAQPSAQLSRCYGSFVRRSQKRK